MGRRGRRAARPGPPARHDGHPLLLVVAADHPDGVPRDQGRRGRRLHLGRRRDGVPVRQGQLRLAAGHAEPGRSPTPRPAVAQASPRAAPTAWHDPREDGQLPDVYIAMGQTAENLAAAQGHHPGGAWTSSASASQNLAEKAIADGFWAREITPVTTARRHGGQQRRRPARRASPRGGRRAQAGVPPGRPGHRRQLLPAQRRRRRGGDHERHQGRASWASPRWPGSSPPASPACPPRSWARPGRGVPAGAGAGRHDHRRHRPGRDQRGVRRPGHPVATGSWASTSTSSTSTAARSPSATRSA